MGHVFSEQHISYTNGYAFPNEMHEALTSIIKHENGYYHSTMNIANKIRLWDSVSYSMRDLALFLLLLTPFQDNQQITIDMMNLSMNRNQVTIAQGDIHSYDDLISKHENYSGLYEFIRNFKSIDTQLAINDQGSFYIATIDKNYPNIVKLFRGIEDFEELTKLDTQILTVPAVTFKLKNKPKYFMLIESDPSYNSSLWIRLISIIPRLFQDFFSKEMFENKELQDIFTALAERANFDANTLNVFRTSVEQYFNKYFNLRRMMLRDAFENINKSTAETLKNTTKVEIDNLNRSIRNYLQELQSAYKTLNEKQYYMVGLEHSNSGMFKPEDMEIIEKLTNIESVKLQTNNGQLFLQIMWKCPLTMIDTKLLQTYRESKRDTHWTNPKDIVNKVLDWTCIEKTHILWVKFKTRLYITNPAIEIEQISNDFRNVTSNWMSHPHINEFRCLGSNESAILNALNKHDLTFALAQLNAAGQQLNLADGTVMERFTDNITNNATRIQLESKADGQFYSVSTLQKRFLDAEKAAEKATEKAAKITPEPVPTPARPTTRRRTTERVAVEDGVFNIGNLQRAVGTTDPENTTPVNPTDIF